jgi:peroxiredoxin Q/BCP
MKRVALRLAALGVLALGIGGLHNTNGGVKPGMSLAAAGAQPASTIDVGAVAPDFSLPDQDNKIHRLSDYKGKTVVLAFYPADMTAGCTLEARGLTGALPEFNKRGVQVLGVSVQDVNSKKQFCDKEGIKYPMLADVGKSVSRSYGVLSDRGLAQRVSFVIGPDGRIAAVDRKVQPLTAARDTLAMIDKVKAEAAPTAEKVQIDAPVAPFTLSNYDGKEVTVGNWAADGNKATVVMFIATKCPVSNSYNTRMADLANTFSARNVRFIGINANKAELSSEVADHAKKHNFSFPVLKDANNVIADRFDARVTPEVYVIDDKGVLRYHGRVDDSQKETDVKSKDLQAALNAVLAGQPVPVKETIAFGCTIKRAG